MLDIDTRRRIDTARDILVGKVPDPKSQVEQITIALIYKFMADMDAEAEELGGQRQFFAGEFERYGWARLLAPGTGGHETLNLYAEAISRMPENPGIPPLFRDIFKNAYLPYRDPETLRAFLKVIDEFTYDHSERLGDAFEYLLSVLGSQGDAGQFRTPRHIIDFMVAVVDPRKDETILDPACGTAGFLISAWKHILAANAAGDRPGAALAPDERLRLMNAVRGYDISPDMVRLSLVNLYLHGFNDPHVYEYDTLTSDERWHEHYHVILANPPFMSPKGGIRPHKRFSVQSNRSEVLFVDYIAEHLLPGGRAAVIVPEGVIFQSGTAYKALRKLLVEEYLAGVISLPAGVFNPYSGVKTSILWLDKTLARQTDNILFVKIEADGFDLGAQRKEIKRNDLPEALARITNYIMSVASSRDFDAEHYPTISIVERTTIAASGDYILSGERYRFSHHVRSDYPLVSLSDRELFRIESGGTPNSQDEDCWNGEIRWITLVDLPAENFVTEIYDSQRKLTEKGLRSSSARIVPENSVVVSSRATIGRIGINRVPLATNQGFKNVIIVDQSRVMPEYVAYVMTALVEKMEQLASGGTFKEISKTNFETLRIPLPPLAEQEAIVAEVESYQRIIDGARQVVANWRPRIDVDPAWPVVKLGEVCDIFNGGTPSKTNEAYWHGDIPWISPKDMKTGIIVDSIDHVTDVAVQDRGTRKVPPNTVLVVVRSGILQHTLPIAITGAEVTFNQDINALIPKNQDVLAKYLYYYLKTNEQDILDRAIKRGGTVHSFHSGFLKELPIALPVGEVQQKVIYEMELEEAMIQANRELITRFEQKIKDRIARVWGEENYELGITN